MGELERDQPQDQTQNQTQNDDLRRPLVDTSKPFARRENHKDTATSSSAASSAALGDTPSSATKRLDLEETYPCPACGSGELSAIALMDIFACNFCRHVFTTNLQAQSLHLADSLQPMAWQWNGKRWRTAQQGDTSAAVVWIFAAVLTVLPVSLIAISNYVFPALESSKDSASFPLTWTALTLLSHGFMSGWLLAEYHRWPWYVGSRVRLRRWKERWSSDLATYS
jgi:hypothetical protein